MFIDQHHSYLTHALKAAEDWGKLSSINIANANTLGYKKMNGYFSPTCDCPSFEDYLNPGNHNLDLNIKHDEAPGKKVNVNGQMVEGSNVDPAEEMKKLVEAANMTRSILTSIQVHNRLQQEILQLGR